MSNASRTVLVIDDSATIRRLVDSNLSREGYNVVLSATAEEGLESAKEIHPDVILLDHQLPGTTGTEVSRQLMEDPELASIPVIISSTLRKQAYVEYADSANVVDMLPKPYTEELLLTTISNALRTGSMVVSSQAHGTSVPEVVRELGEADLTGQFQHFSVRELIDFLNNGRKQGTLELEAGHNRYSIHLDRGRVQGVTSTGTPVEEIVDRLPAALCELAPVLRVTLGKGGSELDGIVDLLNTNVLDPRLLRKLLRHQAAVLMLKCYSEPLKGFRFDGNRPPPPLYQRLPLDVSTLALLIEGSSTLTDEQFDVDTNVTVARQPIRGQNLDRAGLDARQTRIFGKLSSPQSFAHLAQDLDWDTEELQRVLYGLQKAELISCTASNESRSVVILEHDLETANRLQAAFAASDEYQVQVVHDPTAFKILVRRSPPDAVVVDATLPTHHHLIASIQGQLDNNGIYWIESGNDDTQRSPLAQGWIERPYAVGDLIDALDACTSSNANESQESSSSATCVAAVEEVTSCP